MFGSNFVRPDAAPVFTPTPEQFSDPLSYISEIIPVLSRYGIGKIKPPKDWQPPFCADNNSFVFTPRLQHLADVSAFNRAKDTFIDSIISFWEAQDVTLFTPTIKDKPLDLYRLWKYVQLVGGCQAVCEKKMWGVVSHQLGFSNATHLASAVCHQYKKLLLPYDNFLEYKRLCKLRSDIDDGKNRLPSSKKRRPVCTICNLNKNGESLLICEACDGLGACHTYCLNPPLSDIPRKSWFCQKCIASRFRKLHQSHAFGFNSSNKRQTLSKFNIYADEFKANHFGKPAHMVTLEEGEREFWELINSGQSDIVVEYGADLSVKTHSSGFPQKGRKYNRHCLKKYLTSPWNLNNLSTCEKSALRYLPKDVSGMITPWCYVGMIFSCFCWHTEDHWSYSANYLHTGDAKTWYGIPASSADAFEGVMHSLVPELFDNTPDLLQHMTTMICPSVLKEHGIDAYRLDQLPEEFIVTCPRAYHAGFNQGFNFAEAVNFCPADWFEIGQHCIDHYALLRRSPVFSHAELLCHMAEAQEPLSVEFLTVVTSQLKSLLTTERTLRRLLAELGVRRTERVVFEDSDEEKRECTLCRTTLFLSALTCKCSSSMVCLAHHQARDCCQREEQVLCYRYGLDELSDFIAKLDVQLGEFRRWQEQVSCILGFFGEVKSLLPQSQSQLEIKSAYEPQTSAAHTHDDNTPIEDALMNPEDTNSSSEVEVEGGKCGEDAANTVDDKPHEIAPSKCIGECNGYYKEYPIKIEENEKPKLSHLVELLEIGRSRRYPETLVKQLEKVLHTTEECSSVLKHLLENYKLACAKRANGVKSEDVAQLGTGPIKPSKAEDFSESSSSDSDTSSEASSSQLDDNTDGKTDQKVCPADIATLSKRRTNSSRVAGQKVTTVSSTHPGQRTKPDRCRSRRPRVSKLKLAELSSLVQLANSLPTQLPELQQLLQFVTELAMWRQAARQLISRLNRPPSPAGEASGALIAPSPLEQPELGELATSAAGVSVVGMEISLDSPDQLPSVAALDQMLHFGDAVSVELPELRHLRRIHECLTWLESVQRLLRADSGSDLSAVDKPCLSWFCEMQLQGDSVASAVAYVSSSGGTPQTAASGNQAGVGYGGGGSEPLPQTVLDGAMANCSRRLLEVINTAKAAERRLLAVTKAAHGSLSMREVMEEISSAKRLPVSIPLTADVEQLYADSQQLAEQLTVFKRLLVVTPFAQNQRAGFDPSVVDRLALGSVDCTFPHWQTCFEELVEQQNGLPIGWPELDNLKQLISTVGEVRQQLVHLFVRPRAKRPTAYSNHSGLLEIMLPRPSSALDLLATRLPPVATLDTDTSPVSSTGGEGGGSSCRRFAARRAGGRSSVAAQAAAYASACRDNAKLFAKSVLACADVSTLYENVFEPMVEGELLTMLRLRDANMVKSMAQKQEKLVYCLCRKPSFSGFMLQCEVCRDWFHGRCVALPTLKDSETDRLRYICPRCECSLRPDVNRLIEVLSPLFRELPQPDGLKSSPTVGTSPFQRQTICLLQLPEIAAAQMLCERVFRFIHHLRATLAGNHELQCILAEYEKFSGVKMPLFNFVEPTDAPVEQNTCISTPSVNSDCSNLSVTYRTPSLVHTKKGNARISSTCLINTSLASAEVLQRQLDFGGACGRSEPRTPSSQYLGCGTGELSVGHPPRKSPVPCQTGPSERHSAGRELLRPSAETATAAGEEKLAEALAGLTAAAVNGSAGQKSLGLGRSGLHEGESWRAEGGKRDHHKHGSNASARFRYPLSQNARHVLDQLIMQASMLEVSLPQTRWLWQLQLASDPETGNVGAVTPQVALREEIKIRRRFLGYQFGENGLPKICRWNAGRAGDASAPSADDATDASPRDSSSDSEYSSRSVGVPESPEADKYSECEKRSFDGEVDSSPATVEGQVFHFKTPSVNQDFSVTGRNQRRPRQPGVVYRRGGRAAYPRSSLRRSARPVAPGTPTSTDPAPAPATGGCETFANASQLETIGPRYAGPKPQRQRLVSSTPAQRRLNARTYARRLLPMREGGLRRSRRGRVGVASASCRRAVRDQLMMMEEDRKAESPSHLHWQQRISGEKPFSSPSPSSSCYSSGSRSERRRSKGYGMLALKQRQLQKQPRESFRHVYKPSKRLPPYEYMDFGQPAETQYGLHGRQPLRKRMRFNVQRQRNQQTVLEDFQDGRGTRDKADDENVDEEQHELEWELADEEAVGWAGHVTMTRRGRRLASEEQEEEDEEADCATGPRCLRPCTGTVEWIACDDCELWYHQMCVGIRSRAQVPNKYYCAGCRRRRECEPPTRPTAKREPKRMPSMDLPKLNFTRLQPAPSTTSKDLFSRSIASRRPVGWISGEPTRQRRPATLVPRQRRGSDVLGKLLTLDKGDEFPGAYREYVVGGTSSGLPLQGSSGDGHRLSPANMIIDSYSPTDRSAGDIYEDDSRFEDPRFVQDTGFSVRGMGIPTGYPHNSNPASDAYGAAALLLEAIDVKSSLLESETARKT